MIGEFYNKLDEITDNYRKSFGDKSIIVEVLREVGAALHDAYENGEADKVLITDRKPANLAEALLLKHERVTVYQDPNDGQIMYELSLETGDNQYYSRHCDTSYEALKKILSKWDAGWRLSDRLKEKLEYEKERNEELTRKLKSKNGKNEFTDELINKLSELSKWAEEQRSLPKSRVEKLRPSNVKELINKELEKLSPEEREKVEPLPTVDAVVAIMLNRQCTNNEIAKELHISNRTVTKIRARFYDDFGEGIVDERNIPLYRKKKEKESTAGLD